MCGYGLCSVVMMMSVDCRYVKSMLKALCNGRDTLAINAYVARAITMWQCGWAIPLNCPTTCQSLGILVVPKVRTQKFAVRAFAFVAQTYIAYFQSQSIKPPLSRPLRAD